MPTSVLREGSAKPPGRDNLFLWTVFLLLLAALVFACWLGSFYVFGHPEHPRAYRILKRLNKITPANRFVVTKAPPGEFLEAQRLFERYGKYTALQIKRENELLFRNYIRNYTETKKLVPYLTGRYVILKAYELQKTDLFNSGVVVLTQSMEFPQLLTEIVYPTKGKEGVPEMLELLRPGLEIRLQRTHDLSAILQVSHALDGRMQVTVVPLLYGNYALKNGVGGFALEPPESLNVGAGFPLVRGEEVRSVMREAMRRRSGAGGIVAVETASVDQLVRVDELPPGNPVAAEPVASAAGLEKRDKTLTKEEAEPKASATRVPAPEAPVPPAAPAPAPDGVVRMVPAGPPKVEPVKTQVPPAQVANATPPAPAPAPAPSGGAALAGKPPKTIVAPPAPLPPPPSTNTPSTNTPPAAGAAGTNTAAGKVPPQNVDAMAKAGFKTEGTPTATPRSNVAEVLKSQPKTAAAPAPTAPIVAPQPSAAPLKPFIAAAPAPTAGQAAGNWKVYGSGRQPKGRSVTADQATSLQGRNDSAPVYLHGKFVVTAAGGNRAVLRQSNAVEGQQKARVIVEYPAGGVPPQQGSSIAREDGRGFEIREVRRSQDGQVNIFVREVTSQ